MMQPGPVTHIYYIQCIKIVLNSLKQCLYMYMYVTKNLVKLDIFLIAFHSILGKATFLSLSTSSVEKSQE